MNLILSRHLNVSNEFEERNENCTRPGREETLLTSVLLFSLSSLWFSGLVSWTLSTGFLVSWTGFGHRDGFLVSRWDSVLIGGRTSGGASDPIAMSRFVKPKSKRTKV